MTDNEEMKRSMALTRHRDGHQYVLDWMIQMTGKEQNWEQVEAKRRFPPEVKTHGMIGRLLSKRGLHKERLAGGAERRGHRYSAAALYYEAAEDFRLAQHTIFRDDDAEKIFMNNRMAACYDKAIELSGDRIERIDVDFEGHKISGILHLAPGTGPKPTIVYAPGMDMTKEAFPAPGKNAYAKRGMNILSMDGPGQGVSNLRKIRATDNNYERAASAFIDYLVTRPDVDASRLGASGRSMGSFWAMRIAAHDKRIAAVASAVACYGRRSMHLQMASPRFKQIYMYMAGMDDEEVFDEMAAKMHLLDHAANITARTLMVTGEYDPLSSLEDALEVFELVRGPKELWVVEDTFHGMNDYDHFGQMDHETLLADWLSDALAGKAPVKDSARLLIQKDKGDGIYGEEVAGFMLPERAQYM